MKKLITILFLLICLSAGATDVLFNLPDFGALPPSNRNVSVQMVSPFPGNVKQYFAGADGTLTITNMGVAVYQCYIKAPPSQIPFMIQVLSTNLGTVSASSITVASGTATFPAGTVAWSTLASDQRYFQGTNIDASGLQHGNQNITNWGNVSTNAYLTTNAASGFQPFSTNLTDWSHLPTNVVQTGGGGNATNAIANNQGVGTNTLLYGLVISNTLNGVIQFGRSVSVGGADNTAPNDGGGGAGFNFLAGGNANTASTTTRESFIGAGLSNRIGLGDFNAIVGGKNNTIGNNTGSGANRNSIMGGSDNQIGAGAGNNDSYNFIAGGASNVIANGNGNFSAGRYTTNVNASGVFMWSDGTPITAQANNQVLFATRGGMGINTNNPSVALSVNGIISSTNYEIIGNTLFTRNTNSISIVGAGSSAANGTFDLNGGQYTNWLTGSVISNNTSIWVLKNSSGTVLYSLATATPLSSAWTVVSGSGPAPASFFGAVVNESGQVHYGPLTSTNMTWQMTNWINQLTIAPTNSGSSGQVLGLTGADVAWVAQSGGGGGGSNSVSQGNNLVTVATNTGNFAISGVSQTNGQTTLIYTNPSMVLMTNIWIPSSNSLYASIASQIQTATNSSVAAITNTFTYTNDTRSLYLSNVNSKYYGTAKLSALSAGPIKILANNLADIAETNFWELKENSDTSLQFSQATNSIFSAPVGFLKTNGWADASGNVVLFSRQTNFLVYTNDGRALIYSNQFNIFSAQNYNVNANPTFRYWTNTIAIYGSFETTNNTTYTWNGSVYTNVSTGSYVTYNGSGWNIITRGGALQYAISGASPVNGTWTANTGPLPAPTNSSFGYVFDVRGGEWQGILNSTNLDQRMANLLSTNGDASSLSNIPAATWLISVRHSNGTTTNYLQSSNSYANFRLLGTAVSNMVSGDVMDLAPASFINTNLPITIPNNVTIRGSGSMTRIGSGNTCLLVIGANTTLENFNFDNTNSVRGGSAVYTAPLYFYGGSNNTLRNLNGYGNYDVTVSADALDNLWVDGCTFLFDYDSFNTAACSNYGTIRISDSRLTAVGGVYSSINGYYVGRAMFSPWKEVWMLNSVIESSNCNGNLITPFDESGYTTGNQTAISNSSIHLVGLSLKTWNQTLLKNYTLEATTNSDFIYSPFWWGRISIAGTEFFSNGIPSAVSMAVPMSDHESRYSTATNGYIIQLNQDRTEFWASGAGDTTYNGRYVMQSTNSGSGYAKFTNVTPTAYCELNESGDLSTFGAFNPIYVFRKAPGTWDYVVANQVGVGKQSMNFIGFTPSLYFDGAAPPPAVFFKTNSAVTNFVIITYDPR